MSEPDLSELRYNTTVSGNSVAWYGTYQFVLTTLGAIAYE